MGPFAQHKPILIVAVAMLVVAVVWEVVEFTSDQLLGTHVQLGSRDTGMDILLGVLGALSVLGLAAWVGGKSKPLKQSRGPTSAADSGACV